MKNNTIHTIKSYTYVKIPTICCDYTLNGIKCFAECSFTKNTGTIFFYKGDCEDPYAVEMDVTKKDFESVVKAHIERNKRTLKGRVVA